MAENKENVIEGNNKTRGRDLTGMVFGKLLVIGRAPDRKTPGGGVSKRWRCKCSCGNEYIATTYGLVHGITKSCGCDKGEHIAAAHEKNRENLIGKTFGKLTVVKRGPNVPNTQGGVRPTWICDCACGARGIVVREANLRAGNTKSCGCFLSEELVKKNTRRNTYDLSGDYGVGYTADGHKFIFDLENYDLIKDYCWAWKDGYIKTTIKDGDRRRGYCLHWVILGEPDRSSDKPIVDHINGDPADNRKQNLRFVTCRENVLNSKIKASVTESGVPGVTKKKSNGKWIAQISVNNKRIKIGEFDELQDAIVARRQAEETYRGDFSCRPGTLGRSGR